MEVILYAQYKSDPEILWVWAELLKMLKQKMHIFQSEYFMMTLLTLSVPQTPKNKSRASPRIFCHVLFMIFSLLHPVDKCTQPCTKTDGQTDTQPLGYACVTQRYLQHKHTKQARTTKASWAQPPLQQSTLFLPHLLHSDGVQAVYRHNIWQSKRSSGGYCVSLGKWMTPWEGRGRPHWQRDSLLLS